MTTNEATTRAPRYRGAILLPPSSMPQVSLAPVALRLPTIAETSRAADIRPERQQVAEAFTKLRKMGYGARMGAVPQVEDEDAKVVWFDADASRHDFDELGYLRHSLHLNWEGDPEEIVRVLLAEGLDARLPKSKWACIVVRSSGRNQPRRPGWGGRRRW